MPRSPTPDERRAALAAARLHLIFSPALVTAGDVVERLAALLPEVDVVQVRDKPVGGRPGPCDARGTYAWTLRVLELVRAIEPRPLVVVDDRVDVALALANAGVDGVHVGEADLAPEHVRALVGADLLIGLSTHDLAAVAAAQSRPVDYLGFGPVHATATKGYDEARGAERAWVAASASAVPVVPIGGIDLENAHELAPVGRAAVGGALLCAPDPARAARALRAALTADD